MRLATGKRIGQSGHELVLAAFFSLLIHVIFLFAALFLYIRAVPKAYVPPVYDVSLVSIPEEVSVLPETLPPAPKVQKPRLKRPEHPKAMPELKAEPAGKRPEAEAHVTVDEAPRDTVTVQAAPAFKFPWYLAIVTEKIRQNWNPPPGARELRARVSFRIYRSGMVMEPRLEQGSGNFYFDQAAVRAIRMSSPFPSLPEGFGKESVDISVDLEPKE